MDRDKIKEFLTPDNISIKQAMLHMTKNGLKILFVIGSDNRLIGTLTDGDIRRGITAGKELTVKIEEVMTRNFLSVSANDGMAKRKARALMQQRIIEYVPALDDRGEVVNIFAWLDFMMTESHREKRPLLQNPVVIMAGGKGARLDPFTKILPKPLIPLGEKPIIEVIMDRFHEHGFYKFRLLINHKKEMIKLYFRENNQPY
ncbi:MAG: sugar phosphate nucleotidyltransferase, partial [Syntrophales bacterium]|nr:sugar phosphate nucleotidyltransferase [Syntrophales bacterium]